jgi:hypothetical protein
MEIVLLLVALPLFLFGGFALDSLSGDQAETAEDGATPDSDLPPIV